MKPYYTARGISIYHGAFQWVLPEVLKAPCVEAIITDPPYPRVYQHLYSDLGRIAPDILVNGGSLLSIVPHYALPVILADVGQFLKYRWTICMYQNDGAHPRMAMGIEVCWKPIVWWVNGSWPMRRGFRQDRFFSVIGKGEHRKKFHKWEQNLSWARAMLKFVPPGGLVCDPMMGAGTLLVAAQEQGFPAIGIDNDEQCCEIAAKRLEESAKQLEGAA